MRNMSFSLTTPQAKDGSKDVTRRVGWDNLKPGEHFGMIEKGQGLKKGEKIKRIGVAICLSNTKEQVADIVINPKRGTRTEVEREGFPHLTALQFADMFCKHMGVKPYTFINRIEYRKESHARTLKKVARTSPGRHSRTRIGTGKARKSAGAQGRSNKFTRRRCAEPREAVE